MSLSLCPECGGIVSVRAAACPRCGFPVQRREGRQESADQRPKRPSIRASARALATIGLATGLVSALTYWQLHVRGANALAVKDNGAGAFERARDSMMIIRRNAPAIDADSLAALFQQDQFAANERYRGRYVSLGGVVL